MIIIPALLILGVALLVAVALLRLRTEPMSPEMWKFQLALGLYAAEIGRRLVPAFQALSVALEKFDSTQRRNNV